MILLDIDNTLIDHSSAEQNAATLFGEQYKDSIPEYDAHLFVQRWQRAAEFHMNEFLKGEIDFQEQRRRRLQTVFRINVMPANEADEIFCDYLCHYESSWKVFPDVIEFLERNSNKFLAVLSDGAQDQQEAKLKNTGIYNYFQFVVTAESTGMSKPDPKMFHYACELANEAPKDGCYIGDSLHKDAIGANEAGLRGIFLNRLGDSPPEGIESISNLTEYLPDNKL